MPSQTNSLATLNLTDGIVSSNAPTLTITRKLAIFTTWILNHRIDQVNEIGNG